MNIKSPLSIMTLTILLAVIGGALAGVTASVFTQESLKDYLQTLTNRPDVDLISQVKPESLPGTYEEALAKVAEIASPTVAVMRSKSTDSVNPLSWQTDTVSDRSGVVVTSDGWILFSQPMDSSWLPTVGNAEVSVGGERYAIKQIVTDRLTNLIMVKVDGQNLSAIPFGTTHELRSGEFAFGLPDAQTVRPTSVIDVAVVQAAVLPAEEYGLIWTIDEVNVISLPITNASGELIGLADAGAVTSLDQVLPFVQSVLKDGEARYAGLGVQVADINQIINLDSSLKMNQKEGALVSVLPKGPARSSGLKIFDLITAIDGVPVTSTETVALQLKRYAPGTKVKLTVLRAGVSSEIEVTLGDYADLVY